MSGGAGDPAPPPGDALGPHGRRGVGGRAGDGRVVTAHEAGTGVCYRGGGGWSAFRRTT